MSKRSDVKTKTSPSSSHKAAPGSGATRPPPPDNRPAEALEEAHRSAIERGLAEVKGKELAADAEIEAAYQRFER